MKKDNSNEFTQLTIDNLIQTTVFEIVEKEEKKPEVKKPFPNIFIVRIAK